VGTPGLVMKELLRDPLYLAVPEHHALANAKTVLLRQFTGSGC
jgi:DNA-binding transcriptional LysR family regulator